MDALELKCLDEVTLTVPATLQSMTAYVLLEKECWFEKEMNFLRHWLRPRMAVIDIGANLGVYSLPMARLVGETGHVFAYEPGSEARTLLKRSRELNAAINLVAQHPEVDRLSQKCLGTILECLSLGLCIAVGCNHYDRNVWPHGLGLGKKFKAAHPWHVDVGQDQNERPVACIGDALKCHGGGFGKLHCEAVRA